MVQPIDFTKPVYNAVNINIKKPEVDASAKVTNPLDVNFDNGIYNAVKIDIDNPRVNTQPKQNIYDYPESDEIVTYGMLNLNPIQIPTITQEEIPVEGVEEDSTENTAEDVLEDAQKALPEAIQDENLTEDTDEEAEIAVPEPNYTTLEAEKGDEVETAALNKAGEITFKAAEQAQRKPEIVPSEPILPNIDVALVSSNLASKDRDVQALQMEEIVRLAITDKELAKDFLVSDVFSNLINITKEDATKFAPPTKQQEDIRLKFITNWLAAEQDPKAKNNPPYKLTKEEEAIAMELSPMELVERNKEYALTTLGILSELFIEDYEEKEGRVVPITDAPGVAAIVDTLKKDPDSGVKLAALDALRNIARPEYKNELSAIYTIVQTDPNPNVSRTATKALAELDQI